MPFSVQVAPGRAGRGVFATADFAAEDVVEVCPVIDVPAAEITGVLDDYVFSSNQGEDVNVFLLGYGALYNHSSDPNVRVVEHAEDAIALIAIRDIAAGEELVHDYGPEYWETRGITPV